jgi:hypothetical protein
MATYKSYLMAPYHKTYGHSANFTPRLLYWFIRDLIDLLINSHITEECSPICF